MMESVKRNIDLDSVSMNSNLSGKWMKNKEMLSEAIAELRLRFLNEYETNKDLYDECDMERIKKNDYFVRRWIVFNNQGVEKGFEQMKKAYKWRKTFGVNHFDQLIIPIEIYSMGAMFIYPPDKEGNLMLYVRGKMHRKVEMLYERMKQYLIYYINKMDEKQARERSWCIVIDATGTGYDNADLHMLLFIFEALRNYFPTGIKRYVIYGMPWLLNAFATLMLQMMPGFAKKRIKFWGAKELQEHVDEDNLPDFLGGTSKESYKRVPKGAYDIYYVAKRDYNLERDEVDKLLQPSLQYLDIEHCVQVEHI